MDDVEELEPSEVLRSLREAVADGDEGSAARLIGERSVSNRNRLLESAAKLGEKKLVELLLDNGADVNAGAGDNQVTPLARAAWLNYHEVVELLIHRGACVDTVDLSETMTVLGMAALDGYEETVQLLVDHGANVNASLGSGSTALQVAARLGHESIVNLLIQKGADIRAPAPLGSYTALQAAAGEGHEQIMELLINGGADVNEPPGRFTALQAAADSGHLEMVELLINKGAKINANAAEDYGRTALQAAAEKNYEKVVRFLIERGAKVNAPPAKRNGLTALQAAASSGHLEMVELLIKNKADVNGMAGKKHGKTALRAAIGEDGEAAEDEEYEETEGEWVDRGVGNEEGQEGGGNDRGKGRTKDSEKKESKRVKIIKLLLSMGALVRGTKEKGGRNVLHSVCLRGGPEDLDLLDLLLEKSTAKDLNARDSSGSTPLHISVRRKKLKAVKRLLKNRVRLEIEDNSGKTALQVGFREWLKNIPKDPPANTDTPQSLAPRDILKDILKALLENGARTDGLELKNMLKLRDLGHDVSENESDIVMLHDDLTQGTKISDIPQKFSNLQDRLFRSPSICFRRAPHTERPPISFVHPSEFLGDYEPRPDSSGVQWVWSTIIDGRTHFIPRIPDLQEISPIMPVEVVLIGYVSFDCPMQPTIESNLRVTQAQPPMFTNERVEISWIMKLEEDASFLRSVHYRGSINLQYLAIPRNAVHFATLFLGDIHERWKKVIESAKAYLVRRRDSQLRDAGKNHETITILLKDSQEWSNLRKTWKKNVELARKLLAQLQESNILFPEVDNPWQFRKEPTTKDITIRVPGEQKEGEAEADDPSKEQFETTPTPDPNATESIKGVADPPIAEQQKEGQSETEKVKKELGPKESEDGHSVEHKTKGAAIEDPASPALERRETWRRGVGEGDKPNPKSPTFQPTDQTKKIPPKDPKVEKPKENELKILTPDKAAKFPAIEKLSGTFHALVKECEDGIAELEKETTDMIQLEFNLISIYEARRSIETSVSMKRLSWITFIFLPLMFITGVFGMNVNLFQNGAPRWQWYFAAAVPFSLLVISVWILCKYLPGVGKLEKRLDEFLKRVFDSTPLGGSKEPATKHNSNIQSSHKQPKDTNVVKTPEIIQPLRKTLGNRFSHWRGNKGVDEENGNGPKMMVPGEHTVILNPNDAIEY